METHTAKHFALQLGSLACLYLSVGFFLALVFGLINAIYPDSTDGVWQLESNASTIRFGFAMTIVFFPTYLFLTRLVNKNRRNTSDGMYLGLTKWLIYLSLLVGGAVLLGDLVAVIMGFLEGELTARFILKAAAVLLVAGAAFFYYLKDAQGYWLKNERQSVIYGAVGAIVIFTTLAVSLAYINTPQEVRERKVDQQVVSDLQDMQWRIEDYYRANDVLPESIEVLYGEFTAPSAPEGRKDYSYTIDEAEGNETEYRLCGEFQHNSVGIDNGRSMPTFEKNYNWEYKAGEWCFDREIDEEWRQ